MRQRISHFVAGLALERSMAALGRGLATLWQDWRLSAVWLHAADTAGKGIPEGCDFVNRGPLRPPDVPTPTKPVPEVPNLYQTKNKKEHCAKRQYCHKVANTARSANTLPKAAKLMLTISLPSVLEEVEKITAYIGAKLLDTDPRAFDRLSTTPADTDLLLRFWQESIENVAIVLRHLIVAEGIEDDAYRIHLSLKHESHRAIESALFSYFVQYITGSWLALVGCDKADAYLSKAAFILSALTSTLTPYPRTRRKSPF